MFQVHQKNIIDPAGKSKPYHILHTYLLDKNTENLQKPFLSSSRPMGQFMACLQKKIELCATNLLGDIHGFYHF